jgi:hypothetical protein
LSPSFLLSYVGPTGRILRRDPRCPCCRNEIQ